MILGLLRFNSLLIDGLSVDSHYNYTSTELGEYTNVNKADLTTGI